MAYYWKKVINQGCLVDDCPDEHYVKGYCEKHDTQIKKHGRLTPELERERHKGCLTPECPGKHYAKGYCRKHYRQIRT